MRRQDRAITDTARIAAVMQACQAVSVAFGGETPYVVPVSFGFEQRDGRFTLYMHGAREGEKMARLRKDPRAAFAMFTNNACYGEGDTACAYSTSFDSVCGEGTLRILEGAQKEAGLRALMAHYAPGRAFVFEEKALEKTCVTALDVTRISGKHHD